MDLSGIQSLIAALQGGYQAQPVADLKNRMPFEAGGGAPTNSVYVPRGAGEGVQASRKDAIAKGLADGKSYSQIANELGVSRNAVAGTVRDQGLTQNPTGTRDTGYESIYDKGYTHNDTPFSGRSRGIGRGKTLQPSMPQFKFQQEPAPADDPEMAQMMTNYLRSLGIVD